jgi:hypothetical protein
MLKFYLWVDVRVLEILPVSSIKCEKTTNQANCTVTGSIDPIQDEEQNYIYSQFVLLLKKMFMV